MKIFFRVLIAYRVDADGTSNNGNLPSFDMRSK
jgi:hypothetical protein